MEIRNTVEKMAAFRAAFGVMAHKKVSAEYYFWKINSNPAGEGKIVLVEREENIAGSASVTAKNVAVAGVPARAFEIGDTYTNPDYRRRGVFLEAVAQCTDYAASKSAGFVYGTPNDASLPGYVSKAGYSKVEDLRISVMSKRISTNSYQSAVSKVIQNKKLSKLISFILVGFGNLRTRMRSRRIEIHFASAASDIPNNDGYWGSREKYVFFALRDEAFIDWRYFRNPENYKVLFSVSGKTASGLAVTKEYVRGDSKVGVLCDIVSRNDDRSIAISLACAAEKCLTQAGCDYIEAWCSSRSPYRDWLACLGYAERTSVPVIINDGSQLSEKMQKSKDAWHFTFSDSDNM